jgi:hypothetical protein
MRSGGPKTSEGKARSAQNAAKHGILASEAVIRAGEGAEDAAAFEGLLQRLRRDLRPKGELQEMLVERLAVTAWRWRRVIRFELGAVRSRADEAVHDWTRKQVRASEAAQPERDLAPILGVPAPEKWRPTAELDGEDLQRRRRAEERTSLLASLPDGDTLGKIQRYEGHLSREFSRALSQLYEARIMAG